MRVGVVFPQTEIGADPAGVKAYAQAVQQLGYEHVMAYDHVLGADTASRPNWGDRYSAHSLFHEVMVLFGYLAGVAPGLELVSASSSCRSGRRRWSPSKPPSWTF